MSLRRIYSQLFADWSHGVPKMPVRYDTDEDADLRPIRHAREGDAGFDLYCSNERPIVVSPGELVQVPVACRCLIPEGYVGLVKQRSSTFQKLGLFVVDAVMDAGYTGPWFVMVWNPGLRRGPDALETPVVRRHDRLAQLLVVPFLSPVVEAVHEFPATPRGDRGFGSSGR